jgi:hypothetical protein
MKMIEIPRVNPEDWTCGVELGMGLDKRAYLAVYRGEVVKGLVIKKQHLFRSDWRREQCRVELSLHQDLLEIATSGEYSEEEAESAKTALRHLAYIVGFFEDEEGTIHVIQERCRGGLDIGPENALDWNHPLFHLSDMGGNNCGRRLSDGHPVVIDWGMVHDVDELVAFGRRVRELERQEEN